MKELLQLTKVMMTEKKAIGLAVLLGFIASISSVGLLGTGGYLISQAALHPPLYTLTLTIIGVRFFGLSRAASRYAERYFSHKATFSILGRLRVYFYDKIEPLAPGIFSTYRSGDLLSRVVGDVERLQYFFLRVFYPPLVMIIVFLATSMFIFAYSVGVAIVLVIGLFVVGIIVPVLTTIFTEKHGRMLREKRALLAVEMTEFLYGFTDLRTNNRLKEKEIGIGDISDQLIGEQEKEGLLATKGESISLTLAYVTAWFSLLVGTMYVEMGTLDGVFLAMLVLITLTVFEAATPMAVIPGHIDESKAAAGRLFNLTDKKVESGGEKVSMVDGPVAIELKDVSFSYSNSARKSLSGIDLTLAPKKKMAIVGASGSGKSSILNLLLKFYCEYDGKIKVNDQDLSGVCEDEARKLFGVVAQSNHFFNDTVRANLLVADPEASDDQLRKVLDEVSLPHLSLDDALIEKGLSLSGGERQRLAIARMMLKDAPVVLLDEPTNGLDSLTEKEILSTLWPKLEEKSVVFITHRLVGLEAMDEIVVMEKGKIKEQGSYAQLIEAKGYFYELTQLERRKLKL